MPSSQLPGKLWPPRGSARIILACGVLLVAAAIAVLIAVNRGVGGDDLTGRIAAVLVFIVVIGALSGLLIFQIARRDRLTGELADSEARYRQLVELSPEAIFVHRGDRLILVNERCVSLLGATDRAQLIGRSVLSFLHPDDHDAARAAIQRLLRTGEVARFAERRFIRLDGTIVEVEITAALVRERGGRAIQVILRDIGDRKRIVAELRARTRQQEAVAQLGQLALEEIDLDTLFAEATARVAATLGTEIVVILELSPDASDLLLRAGVGWPADAIGTARIPAARGSQAGYTLLSEEVIVVENLAAETRFDKRQPLLDLGAISGLSIVIGGKSRPFGVLGAHTKTRRSFSRDDINFVAAIAYLLAAAITRKQDGQRLRDKQARLFAILNNTADGIVTIDERGTIESANPAAARMFGWAEDELVGRNVKTLLAAAPRGAADDFARSLLVSDPTGAAVAGRELEGRRRDGSIFPLEFGVGQVELSGRRLFIGTLRDLTERRATEEQLRQFQRLEAVGQLSGGIAHDFNNLLTIILGNADLLLDRADPAQPSRRLLETIRAAAERGADLTQQLLAYSRRQSLRTRSFDLNELIGGMNELLRRSLGEPIEIRTNLAADLWPVMADPSQVESALLNLAINARDAMADGGLLVIETANAVVDDSYAARNRFVKAGDYVLLAVTDTGTGMSPDVAARAFEPFFTTKEVGKGTGLGLSMVYGFAQQSGGHAEIYSERGHGTTVRVYLPSATAPAERSRAAEPKARSVGGETILVVEDDDTVRHALAIQLGGLGYRVIEAADGPQALAKLAEADEPVDLLVTDMVLPRGMTGPQLAEAGRRLLPDLRVLYTSGHARDMAGILDQADLDRDPLRKPYQMTELARMVRKILDARRAAVP